MSGIPVAEALQRLRDGNRRFVAEHRGHASLGAARRRELVAGQHPFATVLGCSDSRVPTETVFDQGLGDLFVVRVAGNIAASSQIGSIEFAAARFGTPLVVVLGHSSCGAVQSTLDELEHPTGTLSANLQSIVEHIRPAVEPLLGTGDREAMVRDAVHANVRASVEHLRAVLADGPVVVGAEYSLVTGEVEFFDETV